MLPAACYTILSAPLFLRGADSEKTVSDSCHAGLPGGFGDGLGHGGAYPLVEGSGDDVVRARAPQAETRSARAWAAAIFISSLMSRGPHVEGAPEDAGEGQNVVDLVGVSRCGRWQ